MNRMLLLWLLLSVFLAAFLPLLLVVLLLLLLLSLLLLLLVLFVFFVVRDHETVCEPYAQDQHITLCHERVTVYLLRPASASLNPVRRGLPHAGEVFGRLPGTHELQSKLLKGVI